MTTSQTHIGVPHGYITLKVLTYLIESSYLLKDITRLREDTDFMFEWQEQYQEHKIHIFELPCNVIWTF